MRQSRVVECPNCGTRLSSAHINIHEMVAICPSCDHMFRLDKTAKQLELATQRKIKPPETFDVLETDRELHISYRLSKNLSSLDKISVGFSVLGLIAGSIFTLYMALAGQWLAVLIGGVFLLFVLYYLLLGALNTRRIIMDEDTLSWFDEPLWMPIKRSVSLHEVQRLAIQSSRAAEAMNTTGYHELLVFHHDGTLEIFLDYLPRKNAVYLQQTLQAYLLDDDMTIDGENGAEYIGEDISDMVSHHDEENQARQHQS